jgi:signal transduction histidine kinase
MLTQLQALPLTAVESEGVTKLRLEERRLRTALYVFLEAGVDDPAQETAAKAGKDIEVLIDDAVDRAIFYAYRTSELIESANSEILRSANQTVVALTVGAVVVALSGALLSLLLSSTFKRHLTAILRATRELGKGNFAYRINTPFKDSMGQLGRSIDEMGSRLETYEQGQKAMLDELREAKNLSDTQARELSARAAELAVSEAHLRAQAVVLQARNAELDSFAYAASHDLKAPVVSLQGMADLLAEECSPELGERGRHYVARIVATAGEMGALIGNVLSLARVGREERPAQVVLLDEVADLVIERLAEPIRARDVKVTRGALGEVRALRTQMEQVFSNLIGNAVKYLGTPAAPAIEIGRIGRGGSVEYYVRDNGIGIDPEYHPKIFAPFQRLKEVEVEGTGLGLAIVKKIVEGAGGQLRVESAVGAGSTFFFTWPQED